MSEQTPLPSPEHDARSVRFRPSLITRLTLAVSLILVVFMGLLDYLNLHNFRTVMIQYATTNADQVAEIIRQSTHDAMLKNDKESLYRMVDRIAKSESIGRIRLIDNSGMVAYSTVRGESGLPMDRIRDRNIGDLIAAQGETGAAERERGRIFSGANGEELLGFTKAIYNQPGCSTGACHFHHPQERLLGVLDISISLENLHRKSGEYRLQFIVLTCLLLLMIGILISFLMRRMVYTPVRRLMRHTAQVAEGRLDVRLPPGSRDELGDLAAAFNQMTENLQRAREEISSWAESLERKVEERSREIGLMQAQLHRSEKLASLGNLVAGIAHEINNPLTGVLLHASILNKDPHLDPRLRPDLERIMGETRRCADIVKQLLEFSREAVPHREAVSVNALLERVIALLRHQPTFSRITVISSFGDNLPEAHVDPSQIQQVFVNLLLNACQAMPEGGEIRISTSLSGDGAFVCGEIRDSGCGIPDEHLQRIFDPFFTTKPDGTGLGLSISYGLVGNNGGTIEVTSTPGVGSTFRVSLPVAG